MSSQGFDAGFNAEPSPSPPSPGGETVRMAQTAEASRERGLRRAEPRYTRVVVKKVGPWSVLKFSLLFYLCVMLVILFALVILYSILGAIGALDSVTRLTRDLGLADETFEINGGWLFSRALMFGFAMVIVWSLINLLLAFLYNLISDVVGGIDVTLTERR